MPSEKCKTWFIYIANAENKETPTVARIIGGVSAVK